jgi:hypothetical protein
MNKKISQITVALSLSTVCLFSLITPGLAQSQSEDDVYQSNEKDNSSGTIGGFNPLDLIHNANLSTGRSSEEFSQDSQLQIQDSAEEFRRLQQERMLQQNNNNPESVQENTNK